MSRKIEDLDPRVATLCRALIDTARLRGHEVIVTSTLRDSAEQSALHAQGRYPLIEVNGLRKSAGLSLIREADNRIVTYARRSVHEFGFAFDLALVSGGRPHWDTSRDDDADGPDYAEVGAMGEALGLTWGGRFTHPDRAHFEWTGGLTVGQLSGGMRPPEIETCKEASMKDVKAGLVSTEFYVALIGAIVPVLNGHLGLAIPVEGLVSMAGVVVSYVMSRTWIKGRQ